MSASIFDKLGESWIELGGDDDSDGSDDEIVGQTPGVTGVCGYAKFSDVEDVESVNVINPLSLLSLDISYNSLSLRKGTVQHWIGAQLRSDPSLQLQSPWF